MLEVYCDGGILNNGKEDSVGGYGAVILNAKTKQVLRTFSGALANQTNNTMEMQGAIEALMFLRHLISSKEIPITLYSDSQYVIKGMTTWHQGWIFNNWKTADKKDVKNKERWLQLIALNAYHDVTWLWVKGHSGNEYNELCDSIATAAMKEFVSL